MHNQYLYLLLIWGYATQALPIQRLRVGVSRKTIVLYLSSQDVTKLLYGAGRTPQNGYQLLTGLQGSRDLGVQGRDLNQTHHHVLHLELPLWVIPYVLLLYVLGRLEQYICTHLLCILGLLAVSHEVSLLACIQSRDHIPSHNCFTASSVTCLPVSSAPTLANMFAIDLTASFGKTGEDHMGWRFSISTLLLLGRTLGNPRTYIKVSVEG